MKRNQNGEINHPLDYYVLSLLIILYLVLFYLSEEFIYKDTFYFYSLSDTLNSKTIESILDSQSRFRWIGYLAIPITLLFKFTFATICISVGSLLVDIKIKFKQLFRIVILSEMVFIVAEFSFTAILFLNVNELTIQNVQGFFPLSAISLIGIENVNAQWAIYPLQIANLFEVFYVIMISWLLSRKWERDFFQSLNIVVPSYGLGLLLWITLVSFLTYLVS